MRQNDFEFQVACARKTFSYKQTWQLYQLLFYCSGKTWPRQLTEGQVCVAYGSRKIKVYCDWEAWQLTSSMVAETSHLELWAWRKEQKLWMVWLFKLSKPTSRDIVPPIGLHLLNLSKQCNQWGLSAQMHEAPGMSSHSNHNTLLPSPHNLESIS